MRKQCGGNPAGSTSSMRVLAAGRPPHETQTIRPAAVTVFGGYLRVPGASPSEALSDSVNAAPHHRIAARLRTGVASLAVGLISVLGAPSAVHAANTEPPPIQPGASFCFSYGEPDENGSRPKACGTLGFVLRDRRGGRYITGPAHAFDTTDNKTARAYGKDWFKVEDSNGFGTIVVDDDTADANNTGDDHDPAFGSDVALIRIDEDKHDYVISRVRHWTGPSGVARTDDGKPGDLLYIHDFNGGENFLAPPPETSGRTARLLRKDTQNNNNFFYDDGYLDGGPQENNGASGAPFLLAANGKALGLNGNCLCGTATFGYPTLDYVLRRFSAKYGYSDLELVTAPYHPPPPPERG